MNTLEQNWEIVLETLKTELTPVQYKTWITPIKPIRLDEERATMYLLSDPNFKNITRDRFTEIIKNTVFEVYDRDYEIVFVSSESEIADPSTEGYYSPSGESETLNPRYQFDTFVIGENNQFANAAALAVAESPSKSYNPLFIYGNAGLGKTHLMHAIGNFIEKNNPSMKVLYVSSETFTNELINALINTKNAEFKMEFKSKYRNVDVLLIDDIQFIEKKDSTQVELFHTFEDLYNANKQIILSSDRPPKDIATIDERLRSRFEWGLVADIQPPDFETKVAILRNKAMIENIEIDDNLIEVINIISEKIKSNIRELEGAFNRVVAFGNLTNRKIDKRLVVDVLKDVFSENDLQPAPETIKKKVSKAFDIKIADIESSKRARQFSYPRQIAMYLCRELTDLSLPKIGEYFGGRDHTTVLHACDKITSERVINESLKEKLVSLESEIRGE